MPGVSTTYCDLITERLQELGWSYYRLSKESGVAYTTIKNYSSGVKPTIEKADKILSALGVTMVLGKVAHNE